MKNYADRGGCYPPKPKAEADNTLLDLHNSSYHTQPHPIIANDLCNKIFGGSSNNITDLCTSFDISKMQGVTPIRFDTLYSSVTRHIS